MPTPLQKYKRDLEDEEFIADSAQEKAVRALQNLYDALTEPAVQKANYLEKFKSLLKIKSAEQITGLYFWGGVGRGKTYLVDCFFECLPFDNKLRIHFHRFMQNVHRELKQLDNVENPLHIVADRLAAEVRVLCLDEFHVAVDCCEYAE